MSATSRTYPIRQQADLQGALDDLFGERRLPENFLGINQQYRHEMLGFTKLLEQSRNAIEAAPAQFEDVDVGGGTVVRCLKNGLWLRRDENGPYAVILAQADEYGGMSKLNVEVVAQAGEVGAALCTQVFDALERRLSSGSCYRGRVLSLEQRYQYAGFAPRIYVHDLGTVEREDIILPEEVLRTVEANVLQFADQRGALKELRLSTQKGLLFHGKPGTGKTHCIRYLAGKLKGLPRS